MPHAWRWPVAIACRYVDLCVWLARYVLAFAILGTPLSLLGATIVALASEAAMLCPVQLGFREWVVGMTSSMLTTAESGTVPASNPLALGLMADLFCRAIEVLVAVPVGVPATIWILRRLARPNPASQSLQATEPPTSTGV